MLGMIFIILGALLALVAFCMVIKYLVSDIKNDIERKNLVIVLLLCLGGALACFLLGEMIL